LRRVLTCLAFATWCFLNTWVEFAEGKSAYFSRFDPVYAVVLPVFCWETVVAAAMFGIWEFCRRRGIARSRPIHGLFLASCLVPVGIAAVATLRAFPFDVTPIVRGPWIWPPAFIVGAGVFAFAFLRPFVASRLARKTFLYSWPVLILILVQAARATLLRYPDSSYADRTLAKPFQSPPKPVRAVWIIFDELSQSIAFGKRPPGLELPNLDRLRAGSFYATSAKSPADSTEISMPSLIIGEPVNATEPRGPDSLYLRMGSRAGSVDWSAVPNVFDAVRGLGLNTALVGWFHPYGRLLNRSLTKCYWTAGWLPSGIEERANLQPLPNAMWDRARLQFAALPVAGHLPGMFPGVYHRREKIGRFAYLLDRAFEIANDPSIGLALIHLPIPHPPAIYNRSKGAITAEGRIGYLDSVAFVDRTVGALRRSMEQAAVWDRTAVLISADHGWRTYLWRGSPEWTAEEEAASHDDTSGVPFLLKLPGQTTGAIYTKPLDTIVTRRLLTEILSGGLADPAAIPTSIER